METDRRVRHGDEFLMARRGHLRDRLAVMIERPDVAPPEEDTFNELALAIFRYQTEANPVYGAFVRNRGIEPEAMSDWRHIPPVPTRAFKELPLVCDGPRPVEAVFRTSGTTLGSEVRGEHRVRDLSLYRTSLLASAERHLRSRRSRSSERGAHRTPRPVRVFLLLPSFEVRPESSLAFMGGALIDAWDDGGGGSYADATWSIDTLGLNRGLAESVKDGVPVLLLGTAFAYVHWLDALAGANLPPLPPDSVLMETGGYKGRSRAVPREELYGRLQEALGIPIDHIVNEYGMTELLSQFYEPVLLEGDAVCLSERRHVGPPWVRTRVLEPTTLEPLPSGHPGLLCHFDLANLDSAAAILTEDWGVEVRDGFRVLGRAPGAEPRGCSLTMEELLRVRDGDVG